MKNLKRSFAVVCDRPVAAVSDRAMGERHLARADALVGGGAFLEAVGEYDRALALIPSHMGALFNRAYALASAGRHAEAVDAYRKIATQTDEFPWLWINLGVSLVALERLKEATEAFQIAVDLRPNDPLGRNNLGSVLGRLARYDEALEHLREAVALAPHDIPARLNLSRALQKAHRLEAIDVAKDAIRLAPDDAETWRTLGDAQVNFGEPKLALETYERAHALDPEWSLRDTNNFGLALTNDGHLDEAVAFYHRYLDVQPEDAGAWGHLAIVHATAGYLESSLECFDKALEIEPESPEVHSNRLVIMSYGQDATPAAMHAEAKKWAERNVKRPRFPALPTRERSKLRIGYVSGDFRVHPVGRFVAQILATHDRERFEICAYSNFWATDEVTEEIRAGVDRWTNVCGMSDEKFADLVREDGIDLLIDLTGHTPMHRLTAFGRRLAPVQATWLGYFGTTGLNEMDFILADDILLPESEEQHYTERPARMPNGLYYIQKPKLPIEPSPLPALTNGYVTFGCFNMTTKITPTTIELWSKILRALPDSKMVLNPHGIATPRMHDLYLGLFVENGVSPDRVEFRPTKGREAYFRSFHGVDMMLDTIPFGGGTTTSEALWMGVPVVALSSDRFPGRMTESILRTVGISELMPTDREAYVRLAVDLANNLPRLAELRSTLRPKVEGSRLCDVEAYTRELESTFEWMWANRPA